MPVTLYVGNLPFTTTKMELMILFSKCGLVRTARIIADPDTGQPRGFAFVELESAEAADQAIAQLHGATLRGRCLIVNKTNEAREPESQSKKSEGSRRLDERVS